MFSHIFVLVSTILLALSKPGLAQKEVIGSSVGDSCTRICGSVGHNLVCNPSSKKCQCAPDFNIVVTTNRNTSLCLKPAKLGEECLADEACLKEDANSDCNQVDYTALCKCKPNYHPVFDKAQGKKLCVLEAPLLNSDLVTLLCIGLGMTVFCGLTCLVLRMFARARFGPRRHHYGNAQLPPPITLSAEQGDTSTRVQSRNSSQRSSLAESSRRQSGSLLAPPRQGDGGSRRASNSSIRSTSSNRSQRSYSLRNPSHHNNHQHHPALQHRPSDPLSRSQTSQLNLSTSNNRPVSQDNVSAGGGSANITLGPTSSSPHHIQKGKRSGSAGALPV